MDDDALLAQLEHVANALGIRVRYEPCEDGPGGLCVLRDERVIIVDAELEAKRRGEVLAAALAEVDTEGLYVLPAVREALGRAQDRRGRHD